VARASSSLLNGSTAPKVRRAAPLARCSLANFGTKYMGVGSHTFILSVPLLWQPRGGCSVTALEHSPFVQWSARLWAPAVPAKLLANRRTRVRHLN
jgi:hypothetical protein